MEDIVGLQWMQKTKYDEVGKLVEDKYTWRKMTQQPSGVEDGIYGIVRRWYSVHTF